MFKRPRNSLTASLSVVVAAIVAISGGHAAPAGQPDPRPLVHAIPSDVNSLDPADEKLQQDHELVINVYERLVDMKFIPQANGTLRADPVAVIPQLAESWDIDGPTITFHLRHDVKFYPTGNPMTSADVVYSFQRLVEIPGNGSNQASIAGLFTPDQFVAVDPYTVKITYMDGPHGTPTAIPVALTSMKFDQFAIIDSVEAKKHATADDPLSRMWLSKNLATTGPYYISSRVPNQQIELKLVPDHNWGVQPAFKDVVLRIIGSADLVSLVKGGIVDFAADGLTGRQFDALAQSGFPVLHGDTPDILRISMAMDKEPFTDVRVRQAMVYAIPIDKIIKTALAGRGTRATCLYNPDDATCDNSFAKYTYDLDKAKALLKEAGKTNFSFDFWYSNALPYNNDIAILIADSLKQIGVTANLKPTPAVQLATATLARINGKDETMSGMYLNEATFWLADPPTLTNNSIISKTDVGGSSNWARYSDPEVDALHLKYRNSDDVAARTTAYRTIQDKVAESASTIIPLIVMGRTIVTSPRVADAMFSQLPFARYAYLEPKH